MESEQLICKEFCGVLDWTVTHLGKVTHKHACPKRTDDFCQAHPEGCPIEVTSTTATQIYVGPFRCYWEDGNLWAIDHGDMESWATYPEVYINCPVATRTQPKNDNVDEPRAWVEGYGVISVAGDGAAFIDAHR